MRQAPTDVLLEVTALDNDGYGVGQHQSRTVRVKGALPGEAVTARILRKRKGQLFAEAKEISGAHVYRRRPPCEHFPRCGGCALQHLDYPVQLAFKEQQLRNALASHGLNPLNFAAPVSGPRLRYRRKARLGVKQLQSGLLVGFRESFSARVGRLQSCQTLADPFAAQLPDYARLIANLDCADKIPQLEVAAGDSHQQIIVRHLVPLSDADRAQLAQFERSMGLTLLLQSAGPDSVQTLDGERPPLLSYGLPRYGLSMEFAATEFTQVNAWINARLVDDIGALVRALGSRKVLDLFCGIGNFSLPLARLGLQVQGVELAASAVERAQSNALRNGLDERCEFTVADLYDPQAPAFVSPDTDLLLLDPPRSGAGPNLVGWLGSQVNAVLYVSCNPVSFASDARVLADAGFALERVGIYDMFPQTNHVETLGLFRR